MYVYKISNIQPSSCTLLESAAIGVPTTVRIKSNKRLSKKQIIAKVNKYLMENYHESIDPEEFNTVPLSEQETKKYDSKIKKTKKRTRNNRNDLFGINEELTPEEERDLLRQAGIHEVGSLDSYDDLSPEKREQEDALTDYKDPFEQSRDNFDAFDALKKGLTPEEEMETRANIAQARAKLQELKQDVETAKQTVAAAQETITQKSDEIASLEDFLEMLDDDDVPPQS